MTIIQLTSIAILLVAFYSQTLSAPAAINSNPASHCCFTYDKKQIPRNLVIDYFQTSRRCTLKAVILVTKKGAKICVDPQKTWVQTYMKVLTQIKAQGQKSRNIF
ncbi:C-C motif chemokine 4-like [Protopterus annectens]|uniref:C-C motif chemokine 4-like n=1 Tax=Protopterus annectens TaxID=7888 RepID=UPI001CFC1054|nr:C-C motif chemokine 4-like [Protopterus annectens]